MSIERISLFVSTLCNIGNIKIAPGTIASLATVFFWWLLMPLTFEYKFFILIFLLIISVVAIHYSLNLFYEDDPQNIVIDEFIGMSIPMIFIIESILLALVAFIIFRFLDILKPSFVYYSQVCKGTLGILLDDIISGFLTLLILMHYL